MIPSEKRNEDLLNEKAETSLSSEQWALLTSAVIVRQWANQQTRRLVGMGYHGNKSPLFSPFRTPVGSSSPVKFSRTDWP